MRNARRTVAALAVAAMAACTDGGGVGTATTISDTPSSASLVTSPTTVATESTSPPTTQAAVGPLRDKPLPDPVDVLDTPTGELSDPTFAALPGAIAEFGRLGAATYQIEIPDQWNGRLVMWMHGFESFSPQAHATPPDFRRFLITNGYAWAASSFSSTSMIPGIAADETAALWDHFVADHGRPKWTYVSGMSMGGWATHIAAERYGNRYDGAFGLCGAAGNSRSWGISSDELIVAAYVAGVTQDDIDSATDPTALFVQRVRPVLDDPAVHAKFENLLIAMTGGPRAFDSEGIHSEETTNWDRGMLELAAGVVPPRLEPYELDPDNGVDGADFNAAAIRLPDNVEALRSFTAGTEVTGALEMPLVTLHTTGDGQVPIGEAQALLGAVTAAGRENLLVQRVIEDAGHCGFTTTEQATSFQALVDWVEHGQRPDGTSLATNDLTKLDHTFEQRQRGLAGQVSTITVSGTARLDGRPVDADFVGVHVRSGVLITACQVDGTLDNGMLQLQMYTAAAAAGCGERGTELLPWFYIGGDRYFATKPLPWPDRDVADVEFDFSTATPFGASTSFNEYFGEVYTSSGEHVDHGIVEARIGDAVCGVTSIRTGGNFNGYVVTVIGPDADPACATDAAINFIVDGQPARESVPNSFHGADPTDLTI